MKISKSKMSLRKKVVTGVAIFSLVTVGGYLAVAQPWNSQGSSGRGDVDQNEINYSPATEDDKELNDKRKAELGDDTAQPAQDGPQNTPVSEKKEVTPTISAYGQPAGPGTELTVNGFVPSIIESEGTCTLTLKKGDTTVTTSKAALQNAQNTSCGQFIVPFEKLTVGTWSAVLSYSSQSSSGSSTATEINVK